MAPHKSHHSAPKAIKKTAPPHAKTAGAPSGLKLKLQNPALTSVAAEDESTDVNQKNTQFEPLKTVSTAEECDWGFTKSLPVNLLLLPSPLPPPDPLDN
ncbi:hypothetical protein LOZ51_003074, partial [Ophidiomyces ophidiicola]